MARLEGLNLLDKLTISLGLISALLFPSMSIAQPRIPVPVPPPTVRSTQTLPTPLPSDEEEPDKEEEPAEPSEEPDKEEEPAEPSEEPAELEQGGGTEQIAPKYRTR